MSNDISKIQSHLANRQHARQVHTGRSQPPVAPSIPLPVIPSRVWLGPSLDCYLDCSELPRENVYPIVATADPYVNSHILGYSEHSSEFTEHALVSADRNLQLE